MKKNSISKQDLEKELERLEGRLTSTFNFDQRISIQGSILTVKKFLEMIE